MEFSCLYTTSRKLLQMLYGPLLSRSRLLQQLFVPIPWSRNKRRCIILAMSIKSPKIFLPIFLTVSCGIAEWCDLWFSSAILNTTSRTLHAEIMMVTLLQKVFRNWDRIIFIKTSNIYFLVKKLFLLTSALHETGCGQPFLPWWSTWLHVTALVRNWKMWLLRRTTPLLLVTLK